MHSEMQHVYKLHFGGDSINGSLVDPADASVFIPLTLHAHNFKKVITQILNTYPSTMTLWNNNTEWAKLI